MLFCCADIYKASLPQGTDFIDDVLSSVSLPPPLLAVVQQVYQHYKAVLFLQTPDF